MENNVLDPKDCAQIRDLLQWVAKPPKSPLFTIKSLRQLLWSVILSIITELSFNKEAALR